MERNQVKNLKKNFFFFFPAALSVITALDGPGVDGHIDGRQHLVHLNQVARQTKIPVESEYIKYGNNLTDDTTL